MKSYKEMSDSVIRRVNEHKEKQKERKDKIKKATLAVTGLCVVVLIFVGVWQTGSFGENDKYETVVKITGKDSKASKHVAAEENTRRTTTTKKPTTKSTTKKNTVTKETTTTKEEYLEEEVIPNIQSIEPSYSIPEPFFTRKRHPEKFKHVIRARYYCNGKVGVYDNAYLEEITNALNKCINDGTAEKVNYNITKEEINSIKKTETALMLEFRVYSEDDYREILTKFNDGTSRTHHFDEILLVLEGEKAGYLYLLLDGECSWGEPIKLTNIDSLNTISEIKRPNIAD